jgi:hypothetical protein
MVRGVFRKGQACTSVQAVVPLPAPWEWHAVTVSVAFGLRRPLTRDLGWYLGRGEHIARQWTASRGRGADAAAALLTDKCRVCPVGDPLPVLRDGLSHCQQL